jgi:hypothetical protein
MDKCRIELSQSPIVLLCGGKVPVGPLANFKSLRHALTLQQPEFEIFRPEEITDWSVDGVYKNLVDLEHDLASVSTLVVIILESPGSIAELGAFSQLPEFENKLTVFASNKMDPDSFINLGILRHIESQNNSRVRRYPWNPDKEENFESDLVSNVISDIDDEIGKLNKSQKLDRELGSHLAVVICELLRLFIALKEKELISYLGIMGMPPLSITRLRGLLFLLEKFRLVQKREYSDSVFYLRGNEDHHRLRLTPKKGKSLDALRIKLDCSVFYKEGTDGHRRHVIKTLLKEIKP